MVNGHKVTSGKAQALGTFEDINIDVDWRPGPDIIARSRMLAFAREHGLDTYDSFFRKSVDDPAWFWGAVEKHLGVIWTQPYERVLDLGNGIEWPEWYPGGRMNYVTSAVDRHLATRRDSIALRWEGDDGARRNLTFGELAEEINRACNALKALGVKQGDRVGIFLPMIPETAIAKLACGKMGAIIVPIFSGFGADAAANRLRDAGATHLITADGFLRRGRQVALLEAALEAAQEAGGMQSITVVPRLGTLPESLPDNVHNWNEITAAASNDFTAADTAANDPYMLIYTSGTTGRPKGAVHTHAGFPLKAAMDIAFCFDLHQDDTLFWLTDLGWMMGPWAISGTLIAGGSVMLFEGTPDFPQPDRLWQLVEDHEVNIIGISPTAIRALMPRGDDWADRHDMPSLRAIGSTGEPWNPEPWKWTLEHVGKSRCPIVNYSGGTEIGGGILISSTIHPERACSFSGPTPGTAADVVDPQGNPVRGVVGELVIRQPWVGMTRGFWQDNERYLDSYWSKIPGLWVHGDWAMIDDDGFWYILGRSDDTLNIAGKRVGPAEVESAAVSHPLVREAAAIGVPHSVKGEAIVVFIILSGEADSDVEAEILETVARHLGRPLKPERAHIVSDLPRTRNAKIMRRVIRAAYLGEAPGDLTALENPDAVSEIAHISRVSDEG